MTDEELKQIIKEDFERDADRIMEEVNSDPSLKDVKAPDEIYVRLMRQIRENETAKEGNKDEEDEEDEEKQRLLTNEDEELIRLGKSYKKRRKVGKYFFLVAVIAGALGAGITSVGGPERIINKVKSMVGDREQTDIRVNSERMDNMELANEENAYQQIEDTFRTSPVRFDYLPDRMFFSEAIIEEGTQNARLYYEKGTEKVLSCTMWFNYRTTSTGVDIEDVAIQEYETEVGGNKILVKEYAIEDTNTTRWRAEFEYQKVQYFVTMSGFTDKEVEQTVEKLHFP